MVDDTTAGIYPVVPEVETACPALDGLRELDEGLYASETTTGWEFHQLATRHLPRFPLPSWEARREPVKHLVNDLRM